MRAWSHIKDDTRYNKFPLSFYIYIYYLFISNIYLLWSFTCNIFMICYNWLKNHWSAIPVCSKKGHVLNHIEIKATFKKQVWIIIARCNCSFAHAGWFSSERCGPWASCSTSCLSFLCSSVIFLFFKFKIFLICA